MDRKIFTSMLIIVMAIAAMAGGTLAWFTYEADPFDNVFVAGTVEIDADEEVSMEEDQRLNWNPGDCATKEFTIKNTGTKNITLRGIIEMAWYVATEDDPNPDNEDDWELWTEYPDNTDSFPSDFFEGAAYMDFCDDFDATNWEIVEGEGEDEGIFYINYVGTEPIEPDDEIKLCIKVCLDGPSATNVYQGKKFVLSAKFQAVQASHEGEEGWQWSDFGHDEFPENVETPED